MNRIVSSPTEIPWALILILLVAALVAFDVLLTSLGRRKP